MSLFKRRARLPDGARLYAIGDVHGRFDLLGELIIRICTREGREPADGLTLVLLGDLIDRGPGSAQVINLARECAAIMPDVVTLKGNHEEALVAAWRGNRDALAGWLAVGGLATLASFGADIAACDPADQEAMLALTRAVIPAETIAWLDALPLSLRRGDYLFVHAGIRPGIPLDRQEASDMLWIRDEFLDYGRRHDAIVVHGHSIRDRAEIRRNRIGIDTGAYRTNTLTAVRLEGATREILHATGEGPILLG